MYQNIRLRLRDRHGIKSSFIRLHHAELEIDIFILFFRLSVEMFSLLWLYDDGVYVLTLKFLIIIILFDQLIITIFCDEFYKLLFLSLYYN